MAKEVVKNFNLADVSYNNINVKDTVLESPKIVDANIDNTIEISGLEIVNGHIDGVEAETVIIRDTQVDKTSIQNFEKDDLFVQNSHFQNMYLKNSDFSNAVLDNVTFKNSVFQAVDVVNTQFNNVQFENCTFIDMDLTHIAEASNTKMNDPMLINTQIGMNNGIEIYKNNHILNPGESKLEIHAFNITEKIVELDQGVIAKDYVNLPNQNEYLLVHDLKNEQLYQLTFNKGDLIQLEPNDKQFIEELKATDFNMLLDNRQIEIVGLESDFTNIYHQFKESQISLKNVYQSIEKDFQELIYNFENVNDAKSNLPKLYDLKEKTELSLLMREGYYDNFSNVTENLKKAIYAEQSGSEQGEKMTNMYYRTLTQNKYAQRISEQLQAQQNYLSAVINETVNNMVKGNTVIKDAPILMQITNAESIVKLDRVKTLLTHEFTDNLNKNITPIEFDKSLIQNQIRSLDRQNEHMSVNYRLLNDTESNAFNKKALWSLPKITHEFSNKIQNEINLNKLKMPELPEKTAAPTKEKEQVKNNDMELSR
ncbi:pentapeptide repeat-containing protein [Solibacillus sp. FSL W7-1436]|uniref:pentapeptide repeat-containing protein n=1 Tax=Solibacillus sp. FSL W7-1436 TaxID=2921705 RepID=UPI0030F7DEEA